MARSTGIPRLRGYDSWVDIPSQSSSLSPCPPSNDIITTSLRVQQALKYRRRRRVLDNSSPTTLESRGSSSQEEYDESESDEDHILTSSNELIASNSQAAASLEADSDSEREVISKNSLDEYGNSKAPYNMQHNPASEELPNHNFETINRSIPLRPINLQNLYTPRNMIHRNSHNHTADHDAALRSSLNTLLSIGAAAARGLPLREKNSGRIIASEGSQSRSERMDFRFVSESALMNSSLHENSTLVPKSIGKNASNTLLAEKRKQNMGSGEKSKPLRKNQSDLHESVLYPSFLTWAVSAGVLVLVSVVGFGAGYMIGREVGRQETMVGLNASSFSDGSSCGKEAMRTTSGGLKRLKWSISGGSRGVTTNFFS